MDFQHAEAPDQAIAVYRRAEDDHGHALLRGAPQFDAGRSVPTGVVRADRGEGVAPRADDHPDLSVAFGRDSGGRFRDEGETIGHERLRLLIGGATLWGDGEAINVELSQLHALSSHS